MGIDTRDVIGSYGARDKVKSLASTVYMAAFVVTVLALSACNKTPSEPPLPPKPVQNATAPTTPGNADTSVPAAGSVLTPAIGANAASAAERTNGAMSPAQESDAMPMPGQNNDHSAPVGPAKRASSP